MLHVTIVMRVMHLPHNPWKNLRLEKCDYTNVLYNGFTEI